MWYLLFVGLAVFYFVTGLIKNIIIIYEYFKSLNNEDKYEKYKKLQG